MADALSLFQELQALQTRQRLPPVQRWHPKLEGEIDIRIDRQGTWRHEGVPIGRQPLVRLFASILRRDGNDYYLVTPEEKLKIQVEDAPLLAVDCEVAAAHQPQRAQAQPGEAGTQEILLRTFTDDVARLDADHAIWLQDGPNGPRPYAHIRNGLNALITRPLYYRLVDLGEEADGRLWLSSAGERFDLGATA